jgi:hypothetical protein
MEEDEAGVGSDGDRSPAYREDTEEGFELDIGIGIDEPGIVQLEEDAAAGDDDVDGMGGTNTASASASAAYGDQNGDMEVEMLDDAGDAAVNTGDLEGADSSGRHLVGHVIKKPVSSWIIFIGRNRERVKNSRPVGAPAMTFKEIAGTLAAEFRALSAEERRLLDDEAREDKLRYAREMASRRDDAELLGGGQAATAATAASSPTELALPLVSGYTCVCIYLCVVFCRVCIYLHGVCVLNLNTWVLG